VEWSAVAARLREYAAARPRPAAEQCELCGAGIDAAHGHLVDVQTRRLLCACRPCYLLFTHDGAGGARRAAEERPEAQAGGPKLRAVPERYQLVPELCDEGVEWDALQLPIGLAFLFRNSQTGRVTAIYPSPAGATESELPLEEWDHMGAAIPSLTTLQPDVEAVIVRRRLDGPGGDALIVPIDACYELVGAVRRTWRGFQGGDEVWQAIEDFFAVARQRAEGVDA
jgi:hypothetical protein